MRKYYVSVLLVLSVFICGGTVQAEKITMDQAVERALRLNPALGIQSFAIEQARAELQTRSLLPNPSLNYDREELDLNGIDGGEWIIAAEMPLNFLWRRGPRIGEAEALLEAENFGLDNKRELVRFQTRRLYLAAHYVSLELEARQKSTDLLLDIKRKSQLLKAEGDISGYDQRRIAFEVLRAERDFVAAENELTRHESNLSLLVYRDNLEMKVETEDSFAGKLPGLIVDKLVSAALERRGDLQRARARIAASGAAVQAARRAALPGVNLGLGYKRQIDGFEGPVGRLSVELPLFNRNQGTVAGNQARLDAAKLTVTTLERQIEAEIMVACQSYNRLRTQLAEYRQTIPENSEAMVETAKFSYMEGEISLIELIDAVRTYTEDATLRYGLLRDTYLGLYRLEYLTGGELQ
ncbi:MAG: TolC family protein [Candidatus Glassbacteria bacterium]|nr:TolC family protein [Candidatus Glassbacteria bacterium]